MSNFIDYCTACYKDTGLQLQRKSKILAITALVITPVSVILGILMITTNAIISGSSLLVLTASSVCALVMLRKGKYYASSSFFLYALFTVMFTAIKWDAYQNVYECYVFASLGVFLLLVSALVADKSGQSIISMILVLIAILTIYFVDAYPLDGYKMTELAIQSLSTSCVIVILSGLCSAYVVKNASTLIADVERHARSAQQNYQKLNETMLRAQSGSKKIGEQLSASMQETIDSVLSLKETLAHISTGMNTLCGALDESQSATKANEQSHNIVHRTMSEYNREVERASAGIEEMAAAVASMGEQAGKKTESVHELAKLAKTGSSRLMEIRQSISNILSSAEHIIQMSSFIEDVAERTNLLGLNASIEAAHAGASGRGFAVVAEQIRALSVETANSSRTILATLKDTISAIRLATEQNDEVISFFSRVSEDTQSVSLMIEELIYSIKEVSSSSTDVLQAVQVVSELTGKTEETVQESLKNLSMCSNGIVQVSSAAAQVLRDTQEMATRYDSIIIDAQKAQALGVENLETITALKQELG